MSGYVVLRAETVAYLLERVRGLPSEDLGPIPPEVAEDLRGVVAGVDAPRPEFDRVRGAGPVLSLGQHLGLLEDDDAIDLPRDRQGGAFWRLVAAVTHRMLENEAEAVLRLLGEDGINADQG